MVPSLFTCASEPRTAEIDVASGWGSLANARAVLERHWDTFVNQLDFNYMASISIGINTVRLPVQNGQSHSGISDGQTRLFTNPAYINKTMNVLTHLAQQLQFATNVVGIKILNEPVDALTLHEFYSNAIMAMRQLENSPGGVQSLPMYIHDAFNIQQYSSYLSGRSDFVVEDHHSYFVFTPADDSELASQHTSDVSDIQ